LQDPAGGAPRTRTRAIPAGIAPRVRLGTAQWAVQGAVPFELGWAIPQAVPLEVVQVRPLRAVPFELAWAMLQAVGLEFMHVQSCGWFPWSWWMGERVDGAARVCPKA
jgi:hypothetical protein